MSFFETSVRNINLSILLGVLMISGCAYTTNTDLNLRQNSACEDSDGYNEICLNSKEILNAISSENVDVILSYVPKSGIYFIDGFYKYDEIYDLLSNKTSWLSKYLFTGSRSVKSFAENNRLVKINIFRRGSNAVMVVYEFGERGAMDKLENCMFNIDNKWYFDGIFSCD